MQAGLGQSASRSSDLDVEEVVFVATHTLAHGDSRLLAHYAREVAGLPRVQLWALLYVPDAPTVNITRPRAGVRTCSWGEGALRRELPALMRSLATSGWALEHSPKKRLYYYFHAALYLWNHSVGERYPRLRRMWRVEPDVVFSGSMADLV